MEVLGSMGKRYGTRPSELLGVKDAHQAFCIDLWAHNAGVQREAYLMRQAQRKANRGRR